MFSALTISKDAQRRQEIHPPNDCRTRLSLDLASSHYYIGENRVPCVNFQEAFLNIERAILLSKNFGGYNHYLNNLTSKVGPHFLEKRDNSRSVEHYGKAYASLYN